MGLSKNSFVFNGDTDFDLNFALGYTSKTDITAYKSGTPSQVISFEWLTDSQVRIDPTDLVSGDVIIFLRTVNKSDLPVDLGQPSKLTRENIKTALVHSLHAFHEILDGRFQDLTELDDALANQIEEGVSSAIKNFLFEADFKQEIYIRPTWTSAETPVHTNGNRTLDTADAGIFIITPPDQEIECIVSNGGVVILSFTVDTFGDVTFGTTTQTDLKSGGIVTDIVSGAYGTGLEAAIVLETKHKSTIDFDSALSNYVELFETARNT